MIKKLTLTLLIIALIPAIAAASDLAKEKRWAEQIEQGLMDGEMLYLKAGSESFLTLYTPAKSPKETAIIILHGIGVHPDWPQIIYPLRSQLAEKGWSTLSAQLPILKNEAEYKDYLPIMNEAPPRIKAAVNHLKKQGYKKIVIVAHSLGTIMTGKYLPKAQNHIAGYIGIGMGTGTDYLDKLTIPTLDLYGENDNDDVLKLAPKRKSSGKANKHYQQMQVKGADHFFDGKEDELMKIVTQWLNQLH